MMVPAYPRHIPAAFPQASFSPRLKAEPHCVLDGSHGSGGSHVRRLRLRLAQLLQVPGPRKADDRGITSWLYTGYIKVIN